MTWCGRRRIARRLTKFQIVFKAHPNLAIRMCGDGESRFAFYVSFSEIDPLLWCRVDDLNVDTLVFSGRDVSGDDDEGIGVSCVPYAFWHGVTVSWQDEFYALRWERQSEQREQEDA